MTPIAPGPLTARQPGLDTLRSLAIVTVIVFHLGYLLPPVLGPIARFGWAGVDLFFVLSGYLIGSQLLKPYCAGVTLSLADFYRRRAFRILPAYLVVLTLYFTVPVWREFPGLSPLWQFLTFTENLFIDYSANKAFSLAWSLCVEEHFYLFLPLIILLCMRKSSLRRTVLLLVFIVLAGIASRSYVLIHILRPLGADNFSIAYLEDIYYPTWTRLDGLTAGVSLALIKTYRPAWWSVLANRGHSLFLAGIAITAIALWLFNHRYESLTGPAAWGTVIGFPLLALGLGMLTASSISNNGLLRRFPVPGGRLIATLAFSLYLTHKAVAHLDQVYLPALTANRGTLALLTYAATCLAAAGLLYLCIERPFLRLREKLDGIRRDRVTIEVLEEPALWHKGSGAPSSARTPKPPTISHRKTMVIPTEVRRTPNAVEGPAVSLRPPQPRVPHRRPKGAVGIRAKRGPLSSRPIPTRATISQPTKS